MFRIAFRLFLVIFVSREQAKSSFNIEKKMLRREGWSFKCVLGSFEKSVRSRGRRKIWLWNLGPAYMRQAGPLCRKPGTLVKRNKNQLCDYMTTEPARLAGIPVLWCRDPGGNFPSNHPCRAARGINQAKNRKTGNTLFMGIAFQAHVIRPLLWVVLSRSLHVKALELPFSWFVCERIRLNLINPRVLKMEHGLHVKMLDSASFTVRPWKNATCLWSHFAQ